MSLLLGTRSERLPLDAAVDQLVAAARWAGTPTTAWAAGVLFPEVVDAWDFVGEVAGSLAGVAGVQVDLVGGFVASWGQYQPVRILSGGTGGQLFGLLLALPLTLVAARLAAGLASRAWESEPGSLGAVWAAGRGHTRATLGLWIVLAGLLIATVALLLLPLAASAGTLGLTTWTPLYVLVALPPLLVVCAYAVLLQIVQQLALQSLVQNRRGVSSALVHGWRLVRHAPWSAMRAASCDLVLVVLLAVAAWVPRLLERISGVAGVLVALALIGFVGTVRASFWARVYRGLGGQVAGDPLHRLGDR